MEYGQNTVEEVQKAELEALIQEVHTLRNRLEVSRKAQADSESEVECLLQQQLSLTVSHDAVVSKLKEDHYAVVRGLELKAHGLENELQVLKDEQLLLTEELQKVRTQLKGSSNEEEPLANLEAEIQELSEKHAAHEVACEQHKELNKILLREKSEIMEELSSTREHLEMVQEKLKLCKADISTQAETIEELQESLALTQNELACLKTGPLEAAARGNSLFAEVEDRRQAMLQKCSSLSKKYHEMKNDYGAKCAEISRLKLENLGLRRRWEEDEEEREKRDVWLKDNYEIRIKELMKMVEDMKHEENPVFVNGDSKILTYVEGLVTTSKKEMAKLREEMEWRSSERLNEAKALYSVRCELQALKTQVMSLIAENVVLRDKLEEANISDIPSPGKTLSRLKQALQNGFQDDPSSCLMSILSKSYQANDSGDSTKTTSQAPSIDSLPPSVKFGAEMSNSGLDQFEIGDSNSKDISIDLKSLSHNDCKVTLTETQAGGIQITTQEATEVSKVESLDASDKTSRDRKSIETAEPAKNYLDEFTTSIDSLGSSGNTQFHDDSMEMERKVSHFDDKKCFQSLACEMEQANSNCSPQSDTADSEDGLNTSDEQCFKSQSEGLKVKPSDLTESPDEGASTNLVREVDFVFPDVMKTLPIYKAERVGKRIRAESNNTSVKDLTAGSDENMLASGESSENCVEQPARKFEEPKRSILSKVTRPSLVPLDQNLKTRKVSFAVSHKSVPPPFATRSGEDSSTSSPKKKLVKLPPKPFKTRIVVSKETDYQ